MDNFRLVLLFSLAFVLLLIYQAWQKDYGSLPELQKDSSTEFVDKGITIKKDEKIIKDTVPVVEVTPPSTSVSNGNEIVIDKSREKIIRVETDLFYVELSTIGGTVSTLKLKEYSVSPETPEVKMQLFKKDMPNIYLAQSGLIGTEKEKVPNHREIFSSKQDEYRLKDGDESMDVILSWQSSDGLSVKKIYRFKRASYVIELIQSIENNTNTDLSARSYVQLMRSDLYDPNKSSFIYTYTGAAYYNKEEKYKKVKFEDIANSNLNQEVEGGWIAMLQHYFVSAWISSDKAKNTFYTSYLQGPRYIIGMYSPTFIIKSGGNTELKDSLYVGPKLQNKLSEVAKGLELTVDYGWLTVLAKPIFWVLDHLHSFFHNWGVAIILLTLLIKLIFYKLSETSYKSMANMRKLTPRMQALKDRFGDDKERLNQAMMEMYKKEKINPLGGCLPILVQIPVFIALYWVLLKSVEMRQAPFALWIDNLSAPDPYYVLPLIMGASMLIQQKLNPAPMDPLQAKIMMAMPIMFTVFFAFFPAGLVLYWTVNNILSIAQQWHITRAIEKSGK